MLSQSGRSETQPVVEVLNARIARAVEPVKVVGQIEFAGAAGNGAPMLHRVQELGVPQAAACSCAPRPFRSFRKRMRFDSTARSRPGIDARIRLVDIEPVNLPLELLQHLIAHVAARGDCKYFQETRNGRAAAPDVRRFVVIERLRIEKIEAQKRPHALVERLLVDDPAVVRGWPPRAREWPADSSPLL